MNQKTRTIQVWVARCAMVISVAFCLAGCKSRSSDEDASASNKGALAAAAKQEVLHIWWAQWAPADSLQTLAKGYTQETGVEVEIHQIPWPKFQDQVFQEFGKRQTAFDIVIGDSQWLGRGATRKLYLELSDWLPQAVDLSKLHPLAVKYLAEYPSGSKKYWAAPCETDAVGFSYRKDWFNSPVEQAAFTKRFSRPLAPPKTWLELKDIADFFYRPKEKKYGVALLTGRGYDELVMGFEQVLYAFGGSWGDFQTHVVSGYLDTSQAVAGLDFFKSLLATSPPGGSKLNFGEVLEPLENGTAAMAMNYFAFFPKLARTMGDKVGFFAMPSHEGKRVSTLGGQGLSISRKTSPAQQEAAKKFIAWFLQDAQQKKWTKLPGGFTANSAILNSEAFRAAAPYNAAFAESMDVLQDFWNVPAYNELLAAVVQQVGESLDGSKTSQEALTALTKEHESILKGMTP